MHRVDLDDQDHPMDQPCATPGLPQGHPHPQVDD
jgi:hypothetical protein